MRSTEQRLLVIDGGYATHRAFHALSSSGLSRPDGTPIWALHGFFTSLAKLVAMRAPSHILVALDAPGGCPDRRAMLPTYKGNRTAPKPEFVSQATELTLVLHEAGVPTMAVPGWEADDIVASAATAATAAGMSCDLFSADRDLYQLLTDTTRIVRLDGTDTAPIDIHLKYGCSPQQYIDLAAMRGETADCIEGVPRVGEKTAAKVVAHFGSFEAAVADGSGLESVVSAKIAVALREHADRVRVNRTVATLRRDIPVDIDAAALPLDGVRLAAALQRAGLPAAASAMRNACG
jgi:DNA polymerase-1